MNKHQFDSSLLLSLYLHQANHRSYANLNKFREKMEQSKDAPHHKPYQAAKQKALTYQYIFLALMVIFIILFSLVYSYTRNPYIHLLSMHFALPKAIGCTLAAICATASGFVALTIKVEREAINNLINRAKKQLGREYRKRWAKLSLKSDYTLLTRYKYLNVLKESHHRALEKVAESREIALMILEKIAACPESELTLKEVLYNEAIFELDDRLQYEIKKFKEDPHFEML